MEFTCELCSATFTYKSSFQKHTNSMHKKIRHQCEKCEKSYTSKQNLASHVQIIHETVKHHCNYCNSIFKQKIGLKKHLESKHSTIPIKSTWKSQFVIFTPLLEWLIHVVNVHLLSWKEMEIRLTQPSSYAWLEAWAVLGNMILMIMRKSRLLTSCSIIKHGK